jgi:TonB family protein
LHEQIDLVVATEEKTKPAGFSLAIATSLVLHALLILLFLSSYKNVPQAAKNVPMTRYVELIRQQPKEFVEAPGPEVAKAPITAPFSDKNRKASIPEPTGSEPTNRPGDGREIYTPPMGGGQQQPQRQAQQAQPAQQAQRPSAESSPSEAATRPDRSDSPGFAYREPTAAKASVAPASAMVDWRQAIRQVQPSGGGGSDLIAGAVGGGERGFAEAGPLSFETQWYDWGAYAQSMVSRIRVNWYANMPHLIRSGIEGVVTIRFTIERNGRITNVEMLDSSSHPPYDFAARKAIELSSPLNPLPADFPKSSERVTARFFYNKPVG